MAYKIYGDRDEPRLVVMVEGWDVFGCTLEGVAEDSREWLAQHIDKAFQAAYERAGRLAVRKHQVELCKLLGVPPVEYRERG
jgi:hypothetical protein